MRSLCPFLAGAILLLLVRDDILAEESAQAPRLRSLPTGALVRVDHDGNPLPQDAVARLGSARFRKGFLLWQAAFTPDGKSIVTAGAGQGIIVWNATTGKQELQLPTRRESRHFVLTPDGKFVVTMGKPTSEPEEQLTVYEVATGKVVHRLGKVTLTALALSADGKLLVSAGASRPGFSALQVWDMLSGKLLKEMPLSKIWIGSLAFAAEGKMLAGCELYNSKDTAIHLWDIATAKELPPLQGHAQPIQVVTVSPDGKLLLSAGDDQTIRVWDFTARKTLHVLESKHGPVRSLSLSSDGGQFVSGHGDGTIMLWDTAQAREIRHWQGHAGFVNSISFSPDGKTLVSTAMWECVPCQWDVATGRELHAVSGHRGLIEWLGFAADSQSLLSVSRDRQLLRWNLRSGQAETIYKQPNAGFTQLAVSSDGKTLATLSYEDASLMLWDANGAKGPRTLGTYREPTDRPFAFRPLYICFSPDGRFLAAAVKNKIHLFDVGSVSS